MALAFLPPALMIHTLGEIRNEYRAKRAANPIVQGLHRPDLDQWFLYVYTCYVSDTTTVCKRADWHVSDITWMRTNNNLEGFHNVLQLRVEEFHPNLWKAIDHFQENARETAATVAQLQAGQQPFRRSATYDTINKTLDSLRTQFNQTPRPFTPLYYVPQCGKQLKIFS
jgi:hypothetical protein